MKKILFAAASLILLTPSIALAAWWNPFTWFPPKIVPPISATSSVATTSEKIIATTTPKVQKKIIPVPIPSSQNTSNVPVTQTPVVQTLTVTPPPNTTLCNGTYYTPCVSGQNFVCPASGDGYCQTPTTQSLPAPSAEQLAGLKMVCSFAPQNSQLSQWCADGTVLNGYNTNLVFRNHIDSLVQWYLTKKQQQSTATQQQSGAATAAGAAANYYQTQTQLQQLQNSVNANTAATQQLEQQQYWQNEEASQQKQQSQLQCTTQPWWDAGVLKYSTNCTN